MRSIAIPSRKIILTVTLALGLSAGGSLLVSNSHAADEPAAAVKAEAADPEAEAWTELKAATKPPSHPEEWATQRPSREEYTAFMLKQANTALVKIDAFLASYPDGKHTAEARKLQVKNLHSAASLGDKESAEKLSKIFAQTAADTKLPDDERVTARISKLHLDVRKDGGTDQAAVMKFVAERLIAIQKDFPKSILIYSEMISVAMSDEGAARKSLAKVVAESPEAPAAPRQKAQDILDGKIFNATENIGKRVEIKFTAVDGTEVDLAKMKGKVVLVDFWATWCGPCIAELPHITEAYEKYHAKGFEIIGISFEGENGKEKLTKFTKEKGMTWPQYYDGKFWGNAFGERFNIRGIPAMWLFDKQGNLADVEARDGLADKVAKLLEAK